MTNRDNTIITESMRESLIRYTMGVLNEMSPDVYRRAADKREKQGNFAAAERLREHADDIENGLYPEPDDFTIEDDENEINAANVLMERLGIRQIIEDGIEQLSMVPVTEKLDNTEDLIKLSEHYKQLKRIIPDLIFRLLRVGAKSSVNLIVKWTKAAYKAGVDNKEIVKHVFYSLLFLAVGLIGNTIKDNYNKTPIIPDTHIETTKVENTDAMVVYNTKTDTTVVVMQPDKEKAPVVQVSKKEEKKNDVITSDYKSPIVLLKMGEHKIQKYHISKSMLDALWEIESFKDHIYDAKRPSRTPRSQRELMDGSDWTIGAGHKLTKEECRKMKYNRKITVAQGKKLFAQDMKGTENIVNSMLKTLPYDSQVNYSAGFFDGLCSITMNAGAGNIFGLGGHADSEFWRRMKNCRIDKANKCINKSDIDYSIAKINTQNSIMKGHKPRRRAEYFIMMQPVGSMNTALYNLRGNN